jgi:transcriptional regulator with XRE-family HTH domain
MLPFCERVVSVPRVKYLPSRNRGIPVPREPKTIGEHLRKRRLELGIFQSKAACLLGVSTVTLSRWECDKVYPTWPQQPAVATYLGFDPFTNPTLGSPKGNETQGVDFLSPEAPANLGHAIIRHCMIVRKTRHQIAKELGLSPKTVWNWQVGRRQPSALLRKRIVAFLKVGEAPINPGNQHPMP